MRKLKILSISNSFGVNLNTYASQIALANDIKLDIYVLYIGGCTLDIHVKNIEEDNKAYLLYHNGVSTGKMVSILDGLKLEKEWDYILTQQGSHHSGFIETYEPYLGKILNFVKNNSKFKHFGWQETWAYGKNMDWPNNQFAKYNRDPELMYKKIHECVSYINKKFKNLFIINSGDIVRNALKELKINLYDAHDFHMNEVGCYLIGTNFIKLLLNKCIENIYVPSDGKVDKKTCENIVKFVNKQKGFID